MNLKISYAYIFLFLFICAACNKDSLLDQPSMEIEKLSLKEKYLKSFASILSEAVHNEIGVRKFLKEESLKRFDDNYDVLYYLIKNESINGLSFRDILIKYSSEEEINKIENNVPLLNILVPEVSFFNISPENLDIHDTEIPVAYAIPSKTLYFFNGKEEMKTEKELLPSFHLFVVNENRRVIIPTDKVNSKSTRLSSINDKQILFKSPNFDGALIAKKSINKRSYIRSYNFDKKEIKAFEYFNKDDKSNEQMALQRDYIYYGITPDKKTGKLNRSVSEYVRFIEIDPRMYARASTQVDGNLNNNNPQIIRYTTDNKKNKLTESELIRRFWSQGSFTFRFEVTTSKSNRPKIFYLGLRPDELWNFNISERRRHSTLFRRSKYFYTIDVSKFKSKRIYLGDDEISFGKWNIAEESLTRYVTIIEEDEGSDVSYSSEYETNFANTTTFNGDVKLDIGLGGSVEPTNSNSTKKNKTITVVRKKGSNYLGNTKIQFYDPIILGKWERRKRRKRVYYDAKTYNTGFVKFSIAVK